MPQAALQLIKELEAFLPKVDDREACEYLYNAGYTLNGDFTWTKEGVESYSDMTGEEYGCLLYMVQEWDFGGLTVV